MLTIIIWAAFIAVVAYVYIEIIGHEPFFNSWWQFGLKHFENRWFYKPIWGCQLCFAGQNALWIFIFNWIATNFDTNAPFWRFVFFLIPKYVGVTYSLYLGVFSVSLSILFTFLITKLLKK